MCSVNDIEDGMRIDVEKQQKAAKYDIFNT